MYDHNERNERNKTQTLLNIYSDLRKIEEQLVTMLKYHRDNTPRFFDNTEKLDTLKSIICMLRVASELLIEHLNNPNQKGKNFNNYKQEKL